jgi:hypothetical protein
VVHHRGVDEGDVFYAGFAEVQGCLVVVKLEIDLHPKRDSELDMRSLFVFQ